MLRITPDGRLHMGERFSVAFMRTLRIPDDGRDYPLPPGLGLFPIKRVDDYAERVPAHWREHGGVFFPMYQREAMWLSFSAAAWKPNAVKIAIGKVNVVTGKKWFQDLDPDEQDYLVCPTQPWLDGINAGDGTIKQFVAMPLGMGYTVEAQVTGKEDVGGIQILVFEPRPGVFPDQPPPRPEPAAPPPGAPMAAPFAPMVGAAPPSGAAPAAGGMEMGLGAGGRMTQAILPDPHGREVWHQERPARVFVHICNSAMYRDITGEAPPPTPISARTYTDHGYPWFALYDEGEGTVKSSPVLDKVKSVKEMDAEKGFAPQQDDSSVEIPSENVVAIDKDKVRDGDW
jgi:hypothetical protein